MIGVVIGVIGWLLFVAAVIGLCRSLSDEGRR